MHWEKERDNIRTSYDALAREYVVRLADELVNKPLDRDLLRRIAEDVKDRGPVCDFGCGPCHVGAFLEEFGVEVIGLDISPEMIREGRARYPEIEFFEGDFAALPFKDNFLGGGVAFYSLIHLREEEFPAVLNEIRRTLMPGGPFLASFHLGDESLHLDELWGQSVSLDYDFFTPSQIRGFFESAGFIVEDLIVRDPYQGHEHPSTRCYVLARKAA